MATVGQQSLVSDVGFSRYDDTNIKIKFNGSNWTSISDSSLYNGSTKYIPPSLNTDQVKSNYINFKFKGTKFRFIGGLSSGHSKQIGLKVDGILMQTVNAYTLSADQNQTIIAEILGLTDSTHLIEIRSVDGLRFSFDAVDVDSTGYLAHPILNEYHSINDIKNIGDCIPCKYTSLTSGQVGVFSELGTTVAPLIPAASSVTPSGSFYWVYVGKDYLGRKKFIADRNIQYSISWDTLNAAGICSEKETPILGSNIIPTMTKNVETFGIASSSSVFTYNSHAFEPFYAFNKTLDDSQSWTTIGGIGWLAYDFLSPTKICGFSIKPLKDVTYGVPQFPKNFTFEGWDGSNWIVISTYTNVTISSINDYKTFIIPECNYSKYRMNVSSVPSGNLAIGELEFFYKINPNYKSSIRLLTGGTSALDTDNEWDKIIVNSTLGGAIAANDNNVWNAITPTCRTWASSTTTLNNVNRSLRGGLTTSAGDTVSSWNQDATGNSTGSGFRPVLLIETLATDKFLIKKDSNYYSVKPEYYDESTHTFTPLTLAGGVDPIAADISSFGFDSLIPFITSMTKGSDTFKPCDKLNNCEIKCYAPK